MGLLKLSTVAVCALALTAPVAFGQQTSEQQKCINKMNNAGAKLQAAQSKLINGCVKDTNRGAEPNAEACIFSDTKGKVLKKSDKVGTDHSKNCSGPAPTIAYNNTNSILAIQTAGKASPLDLAHDIFGSPIDTGLFDCDPNDKHCLCQRVTVDRVNKLMSIMSKVFLSCKKNAIKDGKLLFIAGAMSDADISTCITGPADNFAVQEDVKQKISGGKTKLFEALTSFCGNLPDTMLVNDDAFGLGLCSGHTGPAGDEGFTALTDCFEDRVRCRFCQMINDMDELTTNCDTWDNGAADLSCN